MTESNAERPAVGAPPATPWFDRCGRHAHEVLPRDLPDHLLPIAEALLAEQTDEAARRRIGISPRTFSRRVAELLDRLNAATRFQGGAELARRGCRAYCGRDGT